MIELNFHLYSVYRHDIIISQAYQFAAVLKDIRATLFAIIKVPVVA